MIKNHQAIALGMLIIAMLYVYIVFYEDAQEAKAVRQCVEQAKSDIEWNEIMPAVMINGILYYDTGKESPQMRLCDPHLGEIVSTVDSSKMPTENNQSNFGTCFEYYYITDGAVALYKDEKWIMFVSE